MAPLPLGGPTRRFGMPKCSIRFPEDLHAAIAAEAKRLDRTFSWVVVKACRQAVPGASRNTNCARYCGAVMVGSGDDTYDPRCERRAGHDGSHASTGAIDQHYAARVALKSDVLR